MKKYILKRRKDGKIKSIKPLKKKIKKKSKKKIELPKPELTQLNLKKAFEKLM